MKINKKGIIIFLILLIPLLYILFLNIYYPIKYKLEEKELYFTLNRNNIPYPNISSKYSSYKIIWGDTLLKIEQKLNFTRKQLLKIIDINKIEDPDFIIAGDSLLYPKSFNQKEKSN